MKKREATSKTKYKCIRGLMLRTARKQSISLSEAFKQVTQQVWTARNVAAPWWWTWYGDKGWERFATQEEIDAARVTEHVANAQALATEKGITFMEAMDEYKQTVLDGVLQAMATRMGFMQMGGGGHITTYQRDLLYSEHILTNFNFHWAGGDPSGYVLSGGIKPKLDSYKRRIGKVRVLAELPPSTTDVELFGERVLGILRQKTLANHPPKYLLRDEPLMLPEGATVETGAER
jgi:hypothetical protein